MKKQRETKDKQHLKRRKHWYQSQKPHLWKHLYKTVRKKHFCEKHTQHANQQCKKTALHTMEKLDVKLQWNH